MACWRATISLFAYLILLLQAAGAKLSLGRTELAAQKAGHTIVVAELEQKVSEAAKTAALSASAAKLLTNQPKLTN